MELIITYNMSKDMSKPALCIMKEKDTNLYFFIQNFKGSVVAWWLRTRTPNPEAHSGQTVLCP